MIRQPPPLRFIAIVVGGWIGIRAAVLVPDLWVEEGVAAPVAAEGEAERGTNTEREEAAPRPSALPPRPVPQPFLLARPTAGPLLLLQALQPTGPSTMLGLSAEAGPLVPPLTAQDYRPLPIQQLLAPPDRGPNRWSGSAWLLVRRESGGLLASGGVLGGSQFGARVSYRLNGDTERPLALSARVYAPLEQRSAAEVGVGLDWRPFADAPVNVLVERRQRLGREGHSAFSVTLYGGVSELDLPGSLTLDAYAQTGLVGLEGRRPFIDGSASVTAPLGRVRVGAAAWGGAQPDAARLDVGPQATVRVAVAGTNLRVSAEWRLRVAGGSQPGSGPALSIGTDF
jgi:hypothetical protein